MLPPPHTKKNHQHLHTPCTRGKLFLGVVNEKMLRTKKTKNVDFKVCANLTGVSVASSQKWRFPLACILNTGIL